jgi:hypothetical protein
VREKKIKEAIDCFERLLRFEAGRDIDSFDFTIRIRNGSFRGVDCQRIKQHYTPHDIKSLTHNHPAG